jgi:DNA-directed RNA polymerase omega subunit
MADTPIVPQPPKMNRFLMVNAVAERAKSLQRGSRPLLDMGGKLKRPIDIAIEEIRHGLLKVETSTVEPPAPVSAEGAGAGEEGEEAEEPVA